MGGALINDEAPRKVAKAELGTKRVCPNCGTKYYDLHKSPPICPKCGTEFVAATAKPRPHVAPKHVEPEAEKEEIVPAVETISLEEADEELAGGKEGPKADDADEGIEVADDDDDTFLEDDEDEGDDVTDIIGGVNGEDD